MNTPDHPVIQNMERTGYPDGKEPEEPKCPHCGAEAETFYVNKLSDVVGCNCCLYTKEYYEIELN